MALYVWLGVLEDYTSGMVCVLARSEKQAWELLYQKDDTAWWVIQGSPDHFKGKENYAKLSHDNIPKCGYFPTAQRPKKITEPEAFVIWGGG